MYGVCKKIVGPSMWTFFRSCGEFLVERLDSYSLVILTVILSFCGIT